MLSDLVQLECTRPDDCEVNERFARYLGTSSQLIKPFLSLFFHSSHHVFNVPLYCVLLCLFFMQVLP